MAFPTNQSPLVNRILPQEDADALYGLYPSLPRSFMDGCPSCGKNNGYGVNGTVELNGKEYDCDCRDQLQMHKHYLNAGIGKAYHFLTWKDFKGDQDAMSDVLDWINRAEDFIDAGVGLLLFSEGMGTGKTMCGSMALKKCVKLGQKCYMTTFQDLLSNLKSGWKDAQFDKWYRGKIESAQVLMIDDLGKELDGSSGFGVDYARQTLDAIYRTRVQQGRVTILTTNFNPGEISETYGTAIGSLMNECERFVEFGGDDYRKKAPKRLVGHRYIY